MGDTIPGFVYELSKRLAKDNKVFVLTPDSGEGKISIASEGMDVELFTYFYPKSTQSLCYGGGILENIRKNKLLVIQIPFLVLSQLLKSIRMASNKDVKIIHAHWIIPAGFAGMFVKKIFGKKLVVSVHAGDVFPLKNRILRMIAAMVLNSCDYCTVNSRATGEAVRKIADIKDKLEVIPMGVDTDVFKQLSEKKTADLKEMFPGRIVLSVGRLAEKKGIKHLIDALPKVIKKIPDTHLVIVGDGPQKSLLEQKVSDLGISDSVSFAGSVSNQQLPAYYSFADVFVLPSIIDSRGDTEGLGVVLLEAMACGTPVVGSRLGGITDIIDDESTGLLAKSGNPDDIADKIVRILSEEELSNNLVENGSDRINNVFSWKVVTERFNGLFNKLGGG